MERFYSDISRTFGWKAANPSSVKRVEEYLALYTPPENGVVAKLAEFIVRSGSESTGIVVGARGSGKTALCNYVLTAKFHELQSHDVTWLRCDIAKIHALNEDLIENKRVDASDRWTLNEYMVFHGIIVMIEYAEKDLVFKETLSLEAGWQANLGSSPVEKRLSDIHLDLGQAWKLIRNIDFERRQQVQQGRLDKSKDQDLKWFFSQLYDKVDRAIADRLYRCLFQLVREDFEKSTGRLPRIALIFDGVDNIRNDEIAPASMRLGGMSARVWYLSYLKELRQYLNYAGTALPADRYILVVRFDTEVDILPRERANQHRFNDGDRRFEVAAPDVRRAFVKKREYLGSRNDLCLSPENYPPRSERLETFDWFFDEFIRVHASSPIVGKRLRSSIASPNDVLRVVFNNNLRSFYRNLIRSFAYFEAFCKNSDEFMMRRAQEARRDFYRAHSYVILEASILAGNRYMRENFDPQSRGRWCPNFFEFFKSTDSRWNGLVIMRALQAIPSEVSDIPRPTLRQVLARLGKMGYHPEASQVAVYTCLEYGMISLFENTFDINDGVHAFTLVRTEKGDHIEDLIFSRLNYLYLVATGAHFSGLRVEEVSNIAASRYLHRTNTSPRFFHSSALRLVAMLLQHIQAAHARDMSFLDESDADRSVFCAPDFHRIIDDVVFFEREVPENDLRQLQQVINDLNARHSDG
jgi:hypothetical protein